MRKSSLPGCLVPERHSRKPERFDMTTQKWSDIRAQKFAPEELREIDQEIENELLEMEDLSRTGERSANGGTEDPAD